MDPKEIRDKILKRREEKYKEDLTRLSEDPFDNPNEPILLRVMKHDLRRLRRKPWE